MQTTDFHLRGWRKEEVIKSEIDLDKGAKLPMEEFIFTLVSSTVYQFIEAIRA